MSICTRCGKQRIYKSSHTEKLEKTTLIHTVTVCPDPECQKLVDGVLLKEEKNRKIILLEKEKRAHKILLKR